ncbi:MAG: DUF47 family protein [Bryobacterales bacterium]|jgi:hypothetical protein|nr:DUF47 family protein [Bryobacterales bacterium]
MCALRFIPREEKFFDYFADQSSILKEIARRLATGIAGGHEAMMRESEEITKLEQRADVINREVFDKLRKTFITPLDPEDIHTLTSRLEDAIDSAYVTARRIAVYRPSNLSGSLSLMAGHLVEITEELDKAMGMLRTGGEMKAHCFRIREIEEEADRCSQDGLMELFQNETNPIEVIKNKDLIELIEQAVDTCDDVSDILANVVVKNS